MLLSRAQHKCGYSGLVKSMVYGGDCVLTGALRAGCIAGRKRLPVVKLIDKFEASYSCVANVVGDRSEHYCMSAVLPGNWPACLENAAGNTKRPWVLDSCT
jgi:hypothetical protein